MEKKTKPGYFAIIPAVVRYDENLTASAKLLYGEITALANARGFCNASNAYFAKLYGVTPRSISELVTSLVGQGHIIVEIDKEAGNKRYIRLPGSEMPPIENKIVTYSKEVPYPSRTKVPDNNTSSNNTLNNNTGADAARDVEATYRLYLKLFIIPIRLNTNYYSIPEGTAERKELLAKASARYHLSPKRRAAILRRLKDAGPTMLQAAIVGYSREAWYLGENDRGWVADLAEYICRSYEIVEKGAGLYEQQKQGKNANDPWSQ